MTDDTATPVARPTLLNIPTEIVEHIAQVVDPHDLLNFRAVCSDINAKIFRTYEKTHFTERAFLLCSENSLRTLLKIARDHRFSKSMRKIVLLIDDVPDAKGYCWSHAAVTSGDTNDLSLLTAALARLRLHGNVVELEVTDRADCKKRVLDRDTRQPPMADQEGPYLPYVGCFEVVMEALALSDLRVQDLAFRTENWAISLPFPRENTTLAEHTRLVFQNLKRLELHFDVFTNVSEEDVIEILSVLKSAESVQALTLGQRIVDDQAYPAAGHGMFRAALAADGLFPRLEDLVLEGFSWHVDELERFTGRHKSLKRLSLVNVVLCDLEAVTKLEEYTSDDIVQILNQVTGLEDILVRGVMDSDAYIASIEAQVDSNDE